MYAVERLSSYISRGVYTVSAPFHPFGGAVDIIVVQQQDGSFKSSPWYVRFGKFQGVLKTKEKVVSINVNETESGFHMYLDHTGEAFFLREVDGDEGDGAFSPPLSGDEADEQVDSGRLTKSQSVDLQANQSKPVPQIDMGNGKIVARANTRRSRIFSLMFGQKSMKEVSRHCEGDVEVQRISSLEPAEIAADLLEIKWSTNLSNDSQQIDDTSRLSASKTRVELADKNAHDSAEEGPERQDHNVVQFILRETTCSHGDQRMDDTSRSSASKTPAELFEKDVQDGTGEGPGREDHGVAQPTLHGMASAHNDSFSNDIQQMDHTSRLSALKTPLELADKNAHDNSVEEGPGRQDQNVEESILHDTTSPHGDQRMDDTSRSSASETPAEFSDNDVQDSTDEGPGREDHSVAQPTLHGMSSPHDDQRMNDTSRLSVPETPSEVAAAATDVQNYKEGPGIQDHIFTQPTLHGMTGTHDGQRIDDASSLSASQTTAEVPDKVVQDGVEEGLESQDHIVAQPTLHGTDRPPDDLRVADTSSLSASKTPAEVADKDVRESIEGGPGCLDHSITQLTLHETTRRDENSVTDKVDGECSDEIGCPNNLSVITHDELLLASTSSNDLTDRSKGMIEHSTQETSAGCNELRLPTTSATMILDLQDPDFEKLKEDASVNSTVSAHTNIEIASNNDLQDPDFEKLEEDTSVNSTVSVHTNIEIASDNADGHLTTHGAKMETEHDSIPNEGSRVKEVSSSIYSESSVRSSAGVDSSELECQVPNFDCQGLNEVEIHTEVLHKMADSTPEMNLHRESSELISKETLQEAKCSYESHHPGADQESEGTCENSTTKDIDFQSSGADGRQIMTDSLSSLNTFLSTADSVEAGKFEVIHHDNVVEGPTAEKFSVVKQVEVFESDFQRTDFPSSHVFCDNNKMSDEKTSNASGSFDQMVEIDQKAGLDEDEKSRARCISDLSNSIDHVQGRKHQGEGAEMHQLLVLSEVIIIPQNNVSSLPEKVVKSGILSENSEDNQLQFGDIDNLIASGVQGDKRISEDAEADNDLIEDIGEEPAFNDTNRESPLSSNRSFGFRSFSTAASYSSELVQESEEFPDESRCRTKPISIPKSCLSEEGLGEMVGSAPNIRGHIHDLERSDALKPLSCSLDSGSESFKWNMHRKGFLTTLKSQVVSDRNSEQEQPVTEAATAVVEARRAVEHDHMLTNPAVEISLCRHLLFEGMGADAASQVFDSEKVDSDNFSSLGSSVVKNDKLVVRIGGRYFPWDGAAPNVLGMAAFGDGEIFQPESMIQVEKVKNALQGDLSRAIVRSSGSWRLWPFKFGITKTTSSTCPVSDSTVGTDAGSASESIKSTTGDNNKTDNTNTRKKVVRSLVPTSEQLASLNLKEGQNVVTFTFSTPMLGKQLVDAKIYLWKWNTRIVISDVDGTITKSDVLGQFMPLVGKDWSHLGVAHLFSAIKENGYQLLFLSARSISQAYLTRQFLFNLKQDGKALPDGPVVISPDGLFPSLFREVIRRAPHEFKIACLEDIRALFPRDCNPFYAGFGNRDTDEISYLKVGIPKGKIFIINPKGEVAVNRHVDTRSYTSLHALVNGIFPVMSSAEQEDFNSWNYWKMPILDIDNI